MALAVEADVVSRLGRALTAEESARISALLADVSGSVQLFTGQKFVRDDYTMRTRIKRGVVRLPQRPVHSVASVADIDGNAIDHEWDGLDRVKVTKRSTTTAGLLLEVVDITYNAGPDAVPQPIVGVICNIATRALGLDPTEGGVSQESLDGYAYTIGSVGGSGAYGVQRDEMRTLRVFSRPGGSIQLAR